MNESEQRQPSEELALPRGHYYWDGRALRRIADASSAEIGESWPRTKSEVAVAIETLSLCGACSLLVAVLTLPWDNGPFAGVAHSASLLPILLIDPVYRRVTSGQIDIGVAARRAALGFRGSHAARSQQPWWLRATFFIALLIICLELAGYLYENDPYRVGGNIVIFWLFMVPIGLAIRYSGRRKKTTLVAVAALTIPLMSLVDPLLPRVAGFGGLVLAQPGFSLVDNMLINFLVYLAYSPVAMAFGFAGYGLGSLIHRLRTPKQHKPINPALSGPRFSEDGSLWWDGKHWQSATSPDGRWRWSGTAWTPIEVQEPESVR
jgi:hypothetical protein